MVIKLPKYSIIIFSLLAVCVYLILRVINTNSRFSGTVENVYTGCFVDGTCSVTIDGKEVIIAIGDSEEPRGKLIGIKIGQEDLGKQVEVYAAKTGRNKYTIIGNTKYYVRVLE